MENHDPMVALDHLQHALQSPDWPTAVAAADVLAAIGGPDVLALLVDLLQSPTIHIRDAAALALREMGDASVVTPLVQRIQSLKPEDDRSTLVYALQTLDCSDQFRFLFTLEPV